MPNSSNRAKPSCGGRAAVFIAVAAVALLWAVPGVYAQANPTGTASVSGRVIGPDGAAIPGATIEVTDKATNSTKVAVSGREGTFTVEGLAPGTFSVTVSLAGFETATFQNIKLVAGKPHEIKATLTVSRLMENMIVTAGWTPTETLTASRTKMPLKEVPVNIDVISSDFVKDLGMQSADDAATQVSNVYAAPIMENENEKGNFAFRGLAQGNNPTRNYFKWYVPTDTYNVDRMDFGKGSNSLIFGDVDPGGNAAVFTKQPISMNFGDVTTYVTEQGGFRHTVDANLRLHDRLTMRLNAVDRENRTYQDASGYKFRGLTLATQWVPSDKTAIRLEGEIGDYSSARGFQGIYVREMSARGRGFGTAGTYYTSDGVWVQQSTLPSIDRLSANGPAGGSPSLVEGSFFDVAMRNAAGAIVGTKRMLGFPKNYNLRGSFDNHSRPFEDVTLGIDQLVGPVNLEFSYSYQHQKEERNDNWFDQTISTDVNGRPYIDSSTDRKWFSNIVNAARLAASYKLDRFSWMSQTIVAAADYRVDEALNIRWQYFNVLPLLSGRATSINTTADRGRLRLYLDDPRFYSRELFNALSPSALPDTDLVQMRPLKYFASGTSAADGTEWRLNYAGSLLSSGRYFKGRLSSLFGIRYDVGRTYEYIATRKEGRFNEDIDPPRRKDALPGEYQEVTSLSLEHPSFTGGLSLALNKDFNVYAVYSDSFRFQAANTFDRVRIGPIDGVSSEVGIKGDFLNRKLSVTLAGFSIDRQNVVLSWNNVVAFSDSDTEDLMNPNDILPGDPRYKYREPGTASASRNYTATESSTGFDATVVWRPVSGLQLRLVGARTNVESTPNLKSFREYYEAAVKRPDEDPAMLADAKLLLDTLDHPSKATGARASLYSAGWVADYKFPSGLRALRGTRVGVNGSYRDNYLFGSPYGIELRGGGSHLVNAYVMRDQTILGRDIRVRVGVRNLTDLSNDTTRTINFTTMSNGANVYRYAYVPPPVFDLELTFRFGR